MKKLRFAIIGAGVWGRTHAYLYQEHPGVELVGICDRNLDKAKAFAKDFKISGVYDNHRKMIDDLDFDVAAVVTPDFAHGEIVVDCANAGKNMIIEKPLATTYEDLGAIVEAVERNNVRIMTDLHNRWSPPFAKAKEIIADGELGELVSSYIRLNDIIWVATDMLPWASRSSILWFLGSHSVDTLRWIFDDEVKRVYSVSRSGVLKKLGVDTEDVYQTILEFERGGIATMENGWITPNNNPCVNDIKFNITGSKGMINLDLSNNQMIERITSEKNDRPDVLVNHFIHGKAKGFAYESIRHFVDKLLTGEDFIVSLKDAVNTSRVVLAIMESAKSGLPVEIKY